jgi:pyruvate dehydrogenase E2 component (dihydrolipoamide acetyltransferase)
MQAEILMPALSPTMTEGTLARWLKQEGDAIKPGEVIAEIETDKATMEVEAAQGGVLAKILVESGTQNVKVNAPIALLGSEAGVAAPPAAAPPPPPEPKQPTPLLAEAPAVAQPGAIASPIAMRMAAQAGIALSALTGTGPQGRIVLADIARATGKPQAAPPAPPQAQPAPALAPQTLVPHTAMRRAIARRMAESKASVPHFYVAIDICADELLTLRAALNAKAGSGVKLSLNDLIIKAAATALRRVPQVNAAWTDSGVALFTDVDISVAVSIPDGLITPIIRQADRKGLSAISAEMRDLAARARAGKLKPEEFQGGGFSISNMGMYGVSAFQAIVNPPQAAILGIAAAAERAVVRNGQVTAAAMLTATLSVDHRAVDGALAAGFLAAFKAIAEQPLRMLL